MLSAEVENTSLIIQEEQRKRQVCGCSGACCKNFVICVNHAAERKFYFSAMGCGEPASEA